MTTDLEILRTDLIAARLPHSRARIALLAAAAAVTLTAAAFAANHYLGQPAPAHVKATFARLGAWMPRTEKVEISKAEVVALGRHTILYGAPTTGGQYCLELLGHRGFVYQVFCAGRQDPKGLLLYSALPVNHGTAASIPSVSVTGRMSARGRTLDLRTPGHVQRVPLGLHGFFSFEPADQDAARRGRAVLYELGRAGSVTSHVRVPAQIVVDTRGSPARRIDGVIFDPRAKHIFFELWAQVRVGRSRITQTGIGKSIDVRPDGRFSFTTPRQTNFRSWFVSMVVVDQRFRLLVDTTALPDARFWARARNEAKRNGV